MCIKQGDIAEADGVTIGTGHVAVHRLAHVVAESRNLHVVAESRNLELFRAISFHVSQLLDRSAPIHEPYGVGLILPGSAANPA